MGLARRVGAAGALVVLALAAGSVADAVAVTQWAADHAVELGADPGRLVVGGAGAGAWLAAAVAAAARDEGWPPVACQLLVEPTYPEPPAGDLARVAPAVVLAPGAEAAAAAAYAARLRAAGGRALVVAGRDPLGDVVADLVAALDQAATDSGSAA